MIRTTSRTKGASTYIRAPLHLLGRDCGRAGFLPLAPPAFIRWLVDSTW